jgi:DNA-binding SARP family transcriptional activator
VAAQPTDNPRIELLGVVRAWWADQELDLGPARSRAVFALLAMRAGQVVSRQEIITGVWGADTPDTSDDVNLETCVSSLRRVLGSARTGQSGDVLVSVEGGYCLRVDPDAVDVTKFTRLREKSATHAQRGEFRSVVRCLTTALELWRGEALSDVRGPFAEIHHACLGEWRLEVRERRAEAMLALGDHLEVVAELAELVNAHPLRERLRALLMLAQYRAGMPADALDSYRSAQLMAEKLGMQPGRVLRRLNERILANDPALEMAMPVKRPSPLVQSRQLTAPVPATSAPAVGKNHELVVLNDRLRALADGRGGAVWIEGKAGIGKSRLLAASLSDSVTPEMRLLRGAADESSSRFRLRVMTDALQMDPVCTWRDDDPVLAAVEKLSATVDQLCADGPVAIAVDDLHRIDCASLMLWHRLVQITARRPLLLIGTSRPLPRRAEIDWVRDGVAAVGGDLLRLDAEGPLYLKKVVEAGTNPHRRRASRSSTSMARVTAAV